MSRRLLQAVAAAVWIGISWSCSHPGEETTVDVGQGILADENIFGVTQIMSRDGIREAVLRADSLYRWNDSTHVLVLGLRLDIHDMHGRVAARISSERGQLNQETQELKAIGSVVMNVSQEDRTITGEEMWFSQAMDRVWSDGPVEMERDRCRIRGDRFEADLSFTRVKIWENEQITDCGGL